MPEKGCRLYVFNYCLKFHQESMSQREIRDEVRKLSQTGSVPVNRTWVLNILLRLGL